jgi:hypothetical protein
VAVASPSFVVFVIFVALNETRFAATKLARCVVFVARLARENKGISEFCRDKTRGYFVVSVIVCLATKLVGVVRMTKGGDAGASR